MDEIRILTEGAIVVRILISLAFGAILGLDRGLKSRPAGLRTYILVCVGSCIVMMTNQYVYQVFDTGDPVRMAAQVVSGIGFLGAGTIIVTRRNQIRGLTTAAGLWASACVGLAIGIGLYEIALVGGLAVVIVLTSLGHWDFFIRRRARDVDVYIELPVSFSFAVFLEKLRQQGLGISNLQVHRRGGLRLRPPRLRVHTQLRPEDGPRAHARGGTLDRSAHLCRGAELKPRAFLPFVATCCNSC